MTMKVMEFASFDEFEECENKHDDEMVAVVHNKKRNTVCADMITNCKRWRTAVNRFFEALENYPEFDGWKDSIMESCENGFFLTKKCIVVVVVGFGKYRNMMGAFIFV